MEYSKRERISDRGAALLNAATGQEFIAGAPYQWIRSALKTDMEPEAGKLRRFFRVASSGECRFVASLLAVMGCTTLLSVEISESVVVGDYVDGYGLDSDLREEIWSAWLRSSL